MSFQLRHHNTDTDTVEEVEWPAGVRLPQWGEIWDDGSAPPGYLHVVEDVEWMHNQSPFGLKVTCTLYTTLQEVFEED